MRIIQRFYAFLPLVLLIAACSTAPDIVSTDKAEGERYSADEIRRRTVDQPFLLSGDFFRERDRDPETMLILGKSAAKPKQAVEEKPQKAGGADDKRPAPEEKKRKPEETIVPRPMPVSAETLDHPIKVAMVFDPDAVPADRGRRIRSVLSQTAPAHAVVIADQEKIEEMLAAGDCLEKRDLRCIAERLGVYPGVRMLMLVESFQWPEQPPGPSLARISLVDTGLGYRYPPMEISGTVQDSSFVDGFIQGVLHQTLEFAVGKSRIMPWFCRAFSTEETRLYVSAGEKSGLAVGDVLNVTTPGKLVASPTGLPAGWVPGGVEGKVRVETLFGEDFAVCSLVEGRMPGPGDLLRVP